ncbi:MAG: TRAP transporter small permease subunit [Desulfobacterales bacterium]|nr:TRAP transporter small permease subunit [Desulfobacterales bacterium]
MQKLVRFYDISALVVFAAMMACVLLEVVTRNILHIPTTWAEESSRLFCVWAVFLGSASAWYRNAHIVINIIPRRLSGLPKLALQLFNQTLSAIFILCVWFGTLFIMFIQYPAKTTALEISISFFYLGVFVGVTGIVIFHGQIMKQTISDLINSRIANGQEA